MTSLLTREALLDSRTQAGALVGVGIVVWLAATLAFRLVGHALLPPDDPGRTTFVFVAIVPLTTMTAFVVYSLLDVAPERRLTAATLLVLPGMVLDAVSVVVSPATPTAGSTFGGLLLFAYASVLLTGVVPLTYVREESSDPTGSSSPETEPDRDGDAVSDG